MKQVKLEIQSLLCTEKAAITSDQLHSNDFFRLFLPLRVFSFDIFAGMYKAEMAGNIPYIKLGFRSLDLMLKSIPDVVYANTNYIDGLLYVKAVPQAGSEHINALVQGQRKAKKKKPSAKTYNSSYANRFKTFRVSTSVAPNRNFNRNNTNYRMPYKPQSFSEHDNHSNLVPQLMEPRQPTTQQVPAPSPPVWKPRAYSPPPRFRPNPPVHPTDSKNWSNMNKKVSNNLTNSTPAVPRVPEDRSHLKPQPMLPRTPAKVSLPSETKIAPPTPPDSFEDTMPIKPVTLQWKPMEPCAFQPDKTDPLAQSTPRPVSPTEGLILKPTQPSRLPSPTVAESLQKSMANFNLLTGPPKESAQIVKREIPPPVAPTLPTVAESLQKSMANLNISTRPIEQPIAQLPVKQEIREPPAAPRKFSSYATTFSHSVKVEAQVAAKPAVPTPIARAPRVMLASAYPVERSATPDPVSLPATPEPTAPFRKFEYRAVASPPVTPEVVSFGPVRQKENVTRQILSADVLPLRSSHPR